MRDSVKRTRNDADAIAGAGVVMLRTVVVVLQEMNEILLEN